MQAIKQRLKELDPTVFEQFCFDLLKERYPGVEIHHVHGSAGDEGVDLFSGDLENACVVWQCKAFPNGVGKSQKDQIRKSLRTAVSAVKPVRWVLCISVDLDAATHRWWLRLKESYSGHISLELISASELAHQLIFRRTLREAYFPQAIMDVAQLRAAISHSAELSTDVLAALSAENSAQFMDRLRDLNPNFSYELIFRDNTGHIAEGSRAGILLRVQNDDRILNVFARDAESLRQDPPKVHFTFHESVASRVTEMSETGKPFDVSPGEIIKFSSDFDFLIPSSASSIREWRLSVQQSVESLKRYLFRLTFGKGVDSVTYDLVKFQTVCYGQKEIELRSTASLPFVIRLVIGLAGAGNSSMHFQEQLAGFNGADLLRGVTALMAMSKAGELEIYDLELGKRFIRIQSHAILPSWVQQLMHIAEAMLRVDAFYGINLIWPASITESDLHALSRLDELINGMPMPIHNISATMKKTLQLPPLLARDCLRGHEFRFEHHPLDSISLFGVSVVPGPLRISVSDGRVRGRTAFADFVQRAPIGATLDLHVVCPFGAVISAIARSEV